MRNTKRYLKVKQLLFISPLTRLAAIIGLLAPLVGLSQNPILKVYEDWSTVSGSQNMFQRSVTRSITGTTDVVVAGATLNSSGNYDIFLQKLNASGAVLWSQQYNGAGNGHDVALDVQVASNGEIYVAGTYYKDATDSSNAIVLKYGPNGNYRWSNVYNGSGSRNDGYASLLVSGASVVAVGACWGTSSQYDMLTRRLDTAGTTVWTTTADQAGLADGGVSLSASGGSIFVTGGVQTSSTAYKIATWKINPANGAITATTLSTSASIAIDRVNDVQEDASGNVYVAGTVYDATTGFDYKLFKYNASLNLIWSQTWDGAASLDDGITGLALDQNGSVIVTGYTTTAQGKDFATVKYSSGGVEQWASTFDGGGNDSATCIVVNSADTNKIYVSGYSYNGSTNDYWTMRYDGAGTAAWQIGFNSIYNANDMAMAIALDTLNNVIVTGQNQITSTSRKYTTVRYIEKSTMFPEDTASGSATSFVYSENRGQLINTSDALVPQIKYYTQNYCSPRIYFADTSVSYVFIRPDTSSSHNDSLVRVDMKFKNANSGLKIRAMETRDDVLNFYLPHRDRAERVQNYDKLVSFNVWNNVDMIYGSNSAGFKYYFICKPGGGGNPAAQIDLKYQGADSVKIDGSGQLIIYTKLGTIRQTKAAAWQLDANGNYSSLGWQPSYTIISTNEVGFTSFGSYNTALPLVIAVDWGSFNTQLIVQNLEWSTYYGGNINDLFSKVSVDQGNGDNFYAGQSLSTNFPTTISALQTQNSGGWNAVAVKCDSAGRQVYATYFGTDTLLPVSQSLLCQTGAVDGNGNFCIGGRASAYGSYHIWFPNNQPAGAFVDTSIAGNGDAFIAQFNPVGMLRWSTYYGGTGNVIELIRDMEFDSNNNLYVVTDADTLTPRMVQSGAYNDSANRNAMILKFDSNLALKWATMFSTKNGGTADYIAISPNNEVYVSGTAKDSTLPFLYPGAGAYIDSTFNGTSDAYIAKFKDAPNQLIWCTYIGGTGTESGAGMTAFGNNLYFTGSTASTNFPFLNPGGGAYFDTTFNGGTSDAFLMRFNSSGQRLWSTYWGGSATDAGTRISQDAQGNVYVGGSSNSSLPIFCGLNPPYAFCQGSSLTQDGYILCFTPQNWWRWMTGQVGSGVDNLSGGMAVDQNRLKLYTCGTTNTSQQASVPVITQNLGGGAYWQPNLYSGAMYNAFIRRFALDSFAVVGISEQVEPQTGNSHLFVYPNPSDGLFQVIVSSDTKNRVIEVYNPIGQLIQSVKVPDGLSNQAISLNLSEQASGVYLVVLRDEQSLTTTKVIRQ